MNKDKRGRPYYYSDALILIILAVREYFGLPYRQTEGFAKMLGGIWGAGIPSYTQICRRQKELNVPLGVKYDKPVDIAIDSTGIKAFNRGEWIRQKWAVRRGWVKLYITCDIDNHLITSVQVTDEHESDGKEFNKLVDGAKGTVGKISRVFGDSAYDSRANFNFAASAGADPVIKPKMNSTGRSRGSYIRAQTVREFLSDPQAWKKKHRYGQRWQVETVFSSLKRILGEHFTSVLS
ncbi:MAG: IS5 family transposase [Nitrososphaerota archaeon]|jgi:transposase|nr:IS5 family transposase [Nitrososphaerota archaeon]